MYRTKSKDSLNLNRQKNLIVLLREHLGLILSVNDQIYIISSSQNDPMVTKHI